MPPRYQQCVLTVHPVTKEVKASPDPVTIDSKIGEEVLWFCPAGDAEIEFKGDCPFGKAKFQDPEDTYASSGPPSKHQKGRKDPYKYTVTITIQGDPGSPYRRDPGVIVDE